MSLSLAACGLAPTSSENIEEPADSHVSMLPVTNENLQLYERRAEGRVWGSYADESGSIVSFESRSSVPNVTRASYQDETNPKLPQVVTSIEVNGKSFTYTDDAKNKSVRFNGPERPVTEDDIRALEKAGNAVWDSLLRNSPKREWPYEQGSLGLGFYYFSEAPVGHKFTDETFSYGEETYKGSRE